MGDSIGLRYYLPVMNAPLSHDARSGQPSKARFTIDDFYRMSDTGILDRYGRTELIDGEIIVLSPLYLPHARTHTAVFRALSACSALQRPGLEILIGATTELGRYDAPMPDIILLDRAAAGDAQRGIPHDAVRMIVEVAVSTSRYDLGRKRKLYAERSVPEYWVALVKKRKLERFGVPVEGEYRRHDSFDFSNRIESVTLPGVVIEAGTL